MVPDFSQVALKEWAVTVRALAEGQQVLLLRKGGIREEGMNFRIVEPEFLLYPTYEHQREDLLRSDYRPALQQVLLESPGADKVRFSHWAKVEEVIEISEQQKVDDLGPHYIWSPAYAQSRLHWKPRFPLAIMLLRVYRMEQAVTLPFLPEYGGCKSWVRLAEAVPTEGLTPALGGA